MRVHLLRASVELTPIEICMDVDCACLGFLCSMASNLKVAALELQREVQLAAVQHASVAVMLQPSEELSAKVRQKSPKMTGNGIKRALKKWYAKWCLAKLHLEDSADLPQYWSASATEELNTDNEEEFDSDNDRGNSSDTGSS